MQLSRNNNSDCGWKCTSEVAAEAVGNQKKEAEVEEEDNTLHLVEPQLKKKQKKNNSTLMTAEDEDSTLRLV